MSLRIAGMGWVTPLGSGLGHVWNRLLKGDIAAAESISSPLGRDYPVFRVPAEATAQAPAHPRLRRSSAISRFAVVRGAVSNGGVVYTKRFYHEIVESGAQAASPLLFPETVFNAPASHLAAILGISGASYTLVGDGAVGVLALKMAEDLMESEALDQCLVVGAEEADWLLCDAYRKWRLLRPAPPIEPFRQPPRGMILSEGAGAVLLSRSGPVEVKKISPGTNFGKQREAGGAVEKTLAEVCDGETDLVVASANGTFIDEAERAAVAEKCARARVYTMKQALGESVGASGLWQTICAAQALQTQLTPPVSYPGTDNRERFRKAVVSVCGLNQQVAGLRLAFPPSV